MYALWFIPFWVTVVIFIIIKDKEKWLLELMFSLDSLWPSKLCVLWEENRANHFPSFSLFIGCKIDHPSNSTVEELRGPWHDIFKTGSQVKGPFHSGTKVTWLVELGISDSVSFSSLYFLPSSWPFPSPVLVAPYSLASPPASRIISGGLCLLRVQLQLVSRSSSSADWLRDSPASQLWGPLFMITGCGWGARLRRRGAYWLL